MYDSYEVQDYLEKQSQVVTSSMKEPEMPDETRETQERWQHRFWDGREFIYRGEQEKVGNAYGYGPDFIDLGPSISSLPWLGEWVAGHLNNEAALEATVSRLEGELAAALEALADDHYHYIGNGDTVQRIKNCDVCKMLAALNPPTTKVKLPATHSYVSLEEQVAPSHSGRLGTEAHDKEEKDG